MEFNENEKEFLKMATEQHIELIKKNILPGEQMADFITSESYIKFLENIIKKLK